MHKQAPDEVPRLSPPRWFALGALLVGALLPACAGTEAFPHWDLDPTRTWTPVTGITPPLSVAFAALSMIGASVALACHAPHRSVTSEWLRPHSRGHGHAHLSLGRPKPSHEGLDLF